MLGTHALIGVGEALISVAAISFIAVSAPDIFAKSAPPSHVSAARRIAFGLALTAVVAGAASLFTSASPDGLQKIAQDLGFARQGQAASGGLFSGYTIFGLSGALSTALAGIIGVLIVLLLLVALSKIASRRKGA
jgi:cobalt/nickel transport system permease protein